MKTPLILCLALLPILAPAQDKPVFRAGAATSNITPPLGMEIVGNFAPRPIAKHVHDELHVRCLVFDDGKRKLAFAVADNLHLERDVWEEAKKKLEADTGIPASHMMFSSTHTHSSAPAISGKGASLDYRRLVISRVVDGVKRALNNLEPARIAWGTGKLPQWVGNRRWLLKEGIMWRRMMRDCETPLNCASRTKAAPRSSKFLNTFPGASSCP